MINLIISVVVVRYIGVVIVYTGKNPSLLYLQILSLWVKCA